MYYGRKTEELEKLYEEYYALFHIYPFGHEELEYGDADYDDYVRDIKQAIKEKRDLVDIAGYEESDW
jgi:hypothetical protein